MRAETQSDNLLKRGSTHFKKTWVEGLFTFHKEDELQILSAAIDSSRPAVQGSVAAFLSTQVLRVKRQSPGEIKTEPTRQTEITTWVSHRFLETTCRDVELRGLQKGAEKVLIKSQDLPGGPVVKNPLANSGNTDLVPGLKDSTRNGAAEPMSHNSWSLCTLGPVLSKEKPETCNCRVVPSCRNQRKARSWRPRPSTAKINSSFVCLFKSEGKGTHAFLALNISATFQERSAVADESRLFSDPMPSSAAHKTQCSVMFPDFGKQKNLSRNTMLLPIWRVLGRRHKICYCQESSLSPKPCAMILADWM